MVFLATGRKRADAVAVAAAELVVVFGLIGLLTGPLWGSKAWGVWWQWDPRGTSALVLWLVFQSYLLLRRFGGPGSERLAAAVALFGMCNVPFVYWSVNVWRTLHPKTTVVSSLPVAMGLPLWLSTFAFIGLFVLLMSLGRVSRTAAPSSILSIWPSRTEPMRKGIAFALLIACLCLPMASAAQSPIAAAEARGAGRLRSDRSSSRRKRNCRPRRW